MSNDTKTPRCSKCQERMIPGCVGERGHTAIKWTDAVPGYLGVSVNGLEVVSYRCEGCGFLETYALPEGVTLKSVLNS